MSRGRRESRDYYFIKSHMHGMVLDVDGAKTTPGAQVFPYPKHGGPNQHWYDDPRTGTIRSMLNDFCLDIQDGKLVVNPYQPGKQDQQWERKGNVIANCRDGNMVLDIFGANKAAKTRVIKWPAHGGSNQSWHFEEAYSPC